MVVCYDPQSSSAFYRNYYIQQKGNGLSVFRGATVQRGRGIGSFFSKMMRGAMPLLKSGAKVVGKQLLNTGASIANDMIDGQDLKTSATKNFSTGGKKLLSDLTKAFNSNCKRSVTKRKQRRSSSSAKSDRNPHKRPRVSKKPKIFE